MHKYVCIFITKKLVDLEMLHVDIVLVFLKITVKIL